MGFFDERVLAALKDVNQKTSALSLAKLASVITLCSNTSVD